MADNNNANEDLGLGAKVVEENQSRFVNRDGSFNVHRKGVLKHGAFSPYHAALKSSWFRFYSWVFVAYLLVNVLFAGLYFIAGPGAFPSIASEDILTRLSHLFFYSVQVLTPLGTSSLTPATLLANGLLTLEAVVGILGFTIIASLIFARFSNPATNIIFSERAVIAPYKDITGFMIRIVNGRSNELIEVTATVTLSLRDGAGKRVFHRLDLERDKVLVFPLNWTIVHPITKTSPLFGMSAEGLSNAQAEFVVGVNAIDEDLSRMVYARSSYVANEVVVGGKFSSILELTGDGTVVIDPARVHEIETSQLPLAEHASQR